MPCDSIRETQIDLGKINPEILTAALNRLGLNARIQNGIIRFTGGTFYEGRLTSTSLNAEEQAKEIRRAYSGEVIRTQARKYGWQVKETGKNQLEVIKRSL